MSGFKIPLDFSQGNFYEVNSISQINHDEDISIEKNIKKSIGYFLKLLISSPNGSFKPDSRFGFSLENCHFENTNSKEEIKGKRISGKSININNYAKDLEQSILLFEPRLKNVIVKTDFNKNRSKILISINGTIVDTKTEYQQELEFYIWNNNENI